MRWWNKIKMSARQISAHKAYYLLMRFQLRSSPLTSPRSKHASEIGTLRNRLTANPELPHLMLRCHWAALNLTGAWSKFALVQLWSISSWEFSLFSSTYTWHNTTQHATHQLSRAITHIQFTVSRGPARISEGKCHLSRQDGGKVCKSCRNYSNIYSSTLSLHAGPPAAMLHCSCRSRGTMVLIASEGLTPSISVS